jgi:sugar phosphate permease
MLLGGSYYSLSVLAPVMAADQGWSAASFGAAFSMAALLSGLGTPVIGAFVVRFGPQLAMLVGSVLAALAYFLLSTTTAVWHMYAFIILLGVGLTLGTLLPIQQLVGNWFVIRRSLFLGLVLTGSGFGGLVIAPLASGLLEASGSWRTSWLVLAGIVSLPALLALLLARDRPEDLGQRADGAQEPGLEPVTPSQGHTSRVYRSTDQWETRAALRTRALWLMALVLGITFFLLHATTAHQVAYLAGEAGMDLTVAASALGLIAGSSILGRLSAGWLGDRIEPRLVMTGMMLLLGLSLLVLLTSKGLVGVYIYVLSFGIGYGGMLVLAPATVLDYYGAESYAAIMGVSMAAGNVLGALSPLLVGGIKDVSGSYLPAFVLMMGLAILGALCAFLARPPVSSESAGGAQTDPRSTG